MAFYDAKMELGPFETNVLLQRNQFFHHLHVWKNNKGLKQEQTKGDWPKEVKEFGEKEKVP